MKTIFRFHKLFGLMALALGMFGLSGCKYNKACADGSCAPGAANAVNSYSPAGYLGSQSRTISPSSRPSYTTGQPVNPGQSFSSPGGSGTR